MQVVLDVTFYDKMTVEKHQFDYRAVAMNFMSLGIIGKSSQVFHARSLLLKYFWSFVLPILEYCSVEWCSPADSHIKQLNRVVRCARVLKGKVFYGQELPSGEYTTTECGVNYLLLAVVDTLAGFSII